MGRVALVTGGTRGIGRAIAERLLCEGWKVAICGRRRPSDVVESRGCQAWFVPTDVREPAAAETLIAAVVQRFGRVDLLVNNAGGSPMAQVLNSSPTLIEKIVALNLMAPIFLSRAAHDQLRQNGGSIVNIASISGWRAAAGTVAYGAAKAGLLSATEGLAMEWAPQIRVNAVVVGLVENPEQMEHYGGTQGIARIGAKVPMGRMARGADVAAAVLWLASAEAAYITGAQIAVHGGGEPPAFLTMVRE